MGNFKEVIIKSFHFLLEYEGFKISNETLDDFSRDFIVILHKDALRLRFIKDRADVFLDVGCAKDPQEWYEFYKIMSWLKANNYISEQYKSSNNLITIKKYLKENLMILEKLFDGHNYEETKEALDNNRKVNFL